MKLSVLKKETKAFIKHVKKNADLNKQLVFWIDLFCGAGGTSTGIHFTGNKNMFVAACVNHDKNAILSHSENHPNTLHFTEDIRDFEVVKNLKYLVEQLRIAFPNCIINVWASLECTNFSKAKGGQARDADSRTLAEHMFMYLEALHPNYFWIENVREFMSWGPLNEKGKPESKNAGRDYLAWIDKVCSYGFGFDFKILNSANYGAYQSRERLFIQFAKHGMPIQWPEQTHTKDKVESSLFPMERWKPVRDVLDLQDEGKSIFDRKKPLSENTEKRILAGLEKFVAKGNDKFLKKYFSGRPKGKVNSIEEPAGTITTVGGQAIVSATHLSTYYGNGGTHSIEKPCPTITTKDRVAKVDVVFIDQQYGNSRPASIEVPINTLTGVPKFALVNTEFSNDKWIMDTNFNNVGRSIDEPSKTLVASRRHPYLVNANSSTSPPLDLNNPSPSITSRTHLIINPSWFGHCTGIDEPSVTLIARQDKAPLYLMAAESGTVAWIVFEEDSETMVKIKKFMVEYGITDIKMRMLKIPELLQIQGFPIDYKLLGTQTEQKKFIGNAVEVNQAKALVKTNYKSLQHHSTKQ
jgi:DNA (cytosine-5)-methyltransferase 1